MHHFAYRDGVLHAEDVDLGARGAVGTPFYCYSSATHRAPLRVFARRSPTVDALVCYAMKANSNQAVLTTLARLGAGMDVVSEGELRRARAAGAGAKRSYSPASARRARKWRSASTTAFSASTSSRSRSSSVCRRSPAARAGSRRIAMRVNPDIDAHTHAKISTGKSENKFGIPICPRPRRLRPRGAPARRRGQRRRHAYRLADHRSRAVRRRFRAARRFRRGAARRRPRIRHVDVGGGLGIPYREDNDPPPIPSATPKSSARGTRDLGARLIFEPGRLIVGNAGVLVTRVLYVKHGEAKTFVIVDAAMNDLIRPTLYDAHHEILPGRAPAPLDAPRIVADIVGPVCESGDYLALDRDNRRAASRRSSCVMSAGAYGAVQAGTYNSRLLVPEVLVRQDQWALVRPRVTAEELIAIDRTPPWL